MKPLLWLSAIFSAAFISSETTAQPIPPALFNISAVGNCRVVNVGAAPNAQVVPRHGRDTPFDRNIQWFNTAISSAKANRTQAQRLASEMQTLARSDAFILLDWSGPGGSPAHWQTNLLKNVAIAVSVLDHRGAWQDSQRAEVIVWGDTLWRNSHYTRWGRKQSDRWPDTIATAAAAYTMWGVVAPNAKAYSEGKRDFQRVARKLKTFGGTQEFFVKIDKYSKNQASDGWNARIEDKMLGDLVMAAHAAARNGEDLFTKSRGKVSLYNAIIGWQNTLFGDGGRHVQGMDLSFLTTNGAERSWSWTKYFIANYPQDSASAPLRSRSLRIAQSNRYGYVGFATGPATCLFR